MTLGRVTSQSNIKTFLLQKPGQAMSDRKRLLLLVSIMVTVSLVVATLTIYLLYDAAFSEERARLLETVRSQARLMEAIARFDAVYSREDHPGGWQAATLSQIIDAHKNYMGFGETGEFTLARREGDQIVFVLRHRHHDLEIPEPVPIHGKRAEPMRLALSGKSGTIVGLDYRGERVLAAYEPVTMLQLGIVAKIDLTEVRAPFIRAGLVTGVVTIFVVAIGALLFIRVSNPIIHRLEESAAKTRAILDTVVDGIITIDERGMVESLNQAAERIFGFSASEVIGNNVNMLMPSPYREEHNDYLRHYRATGEKRIIGIGREVTGRRKDGSTFPMDLAVGEVQLSGKRLFTAAVRDVTDRKRAEKEAKRRLDELAHVGRVASMGEMASGLAHEINQPLTAIASYAEACLLMLKSKAANTDLLRDSLEEISGQAQRTGAIVRRLRQFVKQAEAERSRVDINSVVRSVLELLEHDISAHRIRLRLELDEQLPEVEIDKIQIDQVLVNLVRNAVDAMDSTEQADRELTIQTAKTSSEEALEVAVSDTGSGLTPEATDHLFDAFFTTKPGGMGLGLVISRSIIQAHRGRLWATPNGDTGATFRFTLPIDNI